MTTETSNARGEWVLVPRVPTEAMLDAVCSAEGIEPWTDEIMRQTYIAMLDAAPPPAAARGDVRGLVLSADEREWLECAIEHMRDDSEPQDLTCADALEALLQRALAAEGVQAGEVADAEVWLFKGTDGAWHTFLNERHRLDTIADGGWDVRKFTALSQQPEARGVVEEEANEQRAIHAYEKHMGVSADDPAYGPDLSQWMAGWNAALTGERNG